MVTPWLLWMTLSDSWLVRLVGKLLVISYTMKEDAGTSGDGAQ